MKYFSALILAFLFTASACSGNAISADLSSPVDLGTPDLVTPVDLIALPDLSLAASCGDRLKNGDETDVDCGGSCPSCSLGKTCSTALDCTSRACAGNICSPGQVGALNVTRDGWSVANGTVSKSKSWLTAQAPMGAGLTVRGVDRITAQSLSGLKTFILISDVESDSHVMPTLSDDEATALRDFVLQGGSLAIFFGYQGIYTENLRAAFKVNLVEVCDRLGTVTFNDQLPSAIRSGPWGTVPSTIAWTANCHENVAPDADSKAVVIASAGTRSEAAYIPPGALGAGSGPVFFFTDWFWSYSDYLDSSDWAVVFQNTVAYLMSH